MKILLINPPMPYGIKGHLQTPLGLCYLSSYVAEIAECMVFDCNVSSNLDQVVKEFYPDLIGINILTSTYNGAIKLFKYLKTICNCKLYCVGGVHASVFPEELLKNGFDFVIRGEGELTFYNIIKKIISNENYLSEYGISYIDDNNKITHNKENISITELDKIPFPNRKNLPLMDYEHESIITSRGCNFKCFYCSSSEYWGHRIRYRSPMNVFEELITLYETGIRTFYFCDDNFTSSHKLVKELCELIISNKLTDIHWSALTRVDTVNIELLNLMKKAGCEVLSLGIENGTDYFLNTVKKTNKEITIRAFKFIKSVGIKTRTTWIVGLGKSYQDEFDSLEFMKIILPDQVSIHCLIPFPNTNAWNYPEKYNLVIDKSNFDWDVMNMTYSPYLLDSVKYTHISKEQILQLINTFKEEMIQYGYNGRDKILESFLDESIIKVIN